MRCRITQCARASVGLCPFPGLYVRKSELSDRNLVNRIIKTSRCGSVYLGVVVLRVCKVCYVYEGYVGSAVVLHI